MCILCPRYVQCVLTFMAPQKYSYTLNGIPKHLYRSFGTGHTAEARGLRHKVCAANGVRTCAARKLFNIFHLKCPYLRSINIAKTSPSPQPGVAPFTFFFHKQSGPMSLGHKHNSVTANTRFGESFDAEVKGQERLAKDAPASFKLQMRAQARQEYRRYEKREDLSREERENDRL